MADSGALRVRRARAHAAGDHSLCKRCPAVRGDAQGAAAAVTALPSPGPDAGLDPVAEMRALAFRLAAAHRVAPDNALLARELRMTLSELLPKRKDQPDDDLTGLFAAL